MSAALLADMLAQKLMCIRIENTDVQAIPLHVYHLPDPAWRQAIVSRLDFDATIQMHDPIAVLVVTERFDGQREQRRLFFGKHRRDLPLRGAVNARVGPSEFPLIEIGL